jgi:Fe2+ or Zn2+ uptake regulation protein
VTEPVDDLGVDAALDLVRSAGGRVTLAKRQVLAVLRANPTHLTAEAITSIVQEQAPRSQHHFRRNKPSCGYL